MKTILINNLNDGINVKADPSALSDGGLVDCVGFDLTKDGVLETAMGVANNDISASLPAGIKQWVQKVYIGTTEYVLATTSLGLYANGVLVDATFTGRFKCVEFLNNVYLVNGTLARRFNGTGCYQWGITAPTTMPTITAGAYLEKVLDTFEDVTTWTANQVNCTVASEAVLFKEGSKSAKFTVNTSTVGYSYKPIVANGNLFTTGEECTDKDYLRFWLYVDAMSHLEELAIFIDVGDGTFVKDYFSYSIASPGTGAGLQALGLGKTADVISEETVSSRYSEETIGVFRPGDQYDPDTGLVSGERYSDTYTTKKYTTVVAKTVTKTVIDPTITDQVLSFWRRNDLFELKSATWKEVKIPKSIFLQSGDLSKTWADMVSVKIGITANIIGAVNVYIDGLKFVGGNDLIGDYWFMYSWGRTDASGNMLEESGASRASKQYNITGPITFDRHPITYAARPLSADPQVNCGIISAIGGGLTDFWIIATVLDNTTVTDTLNGVGETDAIRRLLSRSNEPAPPGTDIVMQYNKIWMVGDSTYPTLVRSSEILTDGTLAPEAWPTRNAYEMANNHKALTNIKVLNKGLVVKGLDGEWSLKVLDPTDSLAVSADKVSDNGLLGADAVVVFPTSHVYPSNGGFIESSGAQATFILPEVEPLIDAGMEDAIGVNVGLVNYFTYSNATYGNRTAKIDLYRSKARFSNLNDILFSCLTYDKNSKTLYGIVDGEVYIVDSGYANEASPERELLAYLKSKVYRPGGRVAWTRINFYHNTGGTYFRLQLWIDGEYIGNFPFQSTTRTQSSFVFGPIPGYDLQFTITGNYTAFGKIYFPIGVYHSG